MILLHIAAELNLFDVLMSTNALKWSKMHAFITYRREAVKLKHVTIYFCAAAYKFTHTTQYNIAKFYNNIIFFGGNTLE